MIDQRIVMHVNRQYRSCCYELQQWSRIELTWYSIMVRYTMLDFIRFLKFKFDDYELVICENHK